MVEYATPEEEWRDLLAGTHPHYQHSSQLRFIPPRQARPLPSAPSSPRCKLCGVPFRAPGALLFRRFGFTPWEKNPRICRRCFEGIEIHAKACRGALEDGNIAGAEVEVSMLFADVRGSSKLARQMPVLD